MKQLPCAILALCCIGAAVSAPAFSGEHDLPPAMGMQVGPMGGPPGLGGPDGPGGRMRGHGPALHLSEAQEQKAFALRHALEPVRFEQMAILRKAHEGLRALADAGQFDEAKAGAYSQAIGKAAAALALAQARSDAQFMAMLTPEQRATLQDEGGRPPMPPRP